MKKILHVVPVLAYGGVEKVIRNYYTVIDHSRYHFDYVTHGKEEDYHSEIKNNGGKVYYLPTIGSVGLYKYIASIKRNIVISEYDYVHIHTGDITGIYAYAYRRCGAKKIVSHAHTAKAINKTRQKVEWILRIIANIESEQRLACGKEAGDFCFGHNRYTVLPNAINSKEFNSVSQEQIELCRQELNIPRNSSIIGHVGAMVDQKNQGFLIEIFQKIVEEHPNTFLILVGDGPDRERIIRMIDNYNLHNNVKILGIRNDVNILMHLFDLFVFPSLFEGLPVVGVEAQTAGLKCLLSDQIDQGVDIGCGLCTFLPIDKGIQVWVNKIEEIIGRPKESINEQLIEMALCKNNFSIMNTKKILENVYEN